jgi:aspartyl-tRNA(Asn)/glutamyl-tRNA(Gln) amidotransferase subunit C
MALSERDVLHIAKLADLALTEDEVSRLRVDLGAILAHVEQLGELDTTDVPPTTHVAVREMPLRPDVAEPGLARDAATGAAPRVTDGAFAVPKFVDD